MVRPSLDHIVIVLPHSLLKSPPASISGNFTLYTGGKHHHGLTENTLIPLKSGTYVEIVAFFSNDPATRSGHYWGSKKPGWADWGFTEVGEAGPPTTVPFVGAASIPKQEEAEETLLIGPKRSKLEYNRPVAGGRTRPDGQRVDWLSTFPAPAIVRGSEPFWCHDVTPRQLRVPSAEAEVTHASGAVAVAEVRLAARVEDIQSYIASYATQVGEKAEEMTETQYEGSWCIKVGQPCGENLPNTRIVVGMARDESEEKLLESEGGQAAVMGVIFFVDGEPPASIQDEIEGRRFSIGFRKL